jgi:lipoate-protein ligase B
MIPCGIPGCEVTSLEVETSAPVDVAAVAGEMADQLASAFGLRLAEDR